VPDTINALKAIGRGDIGVVAGGIIPESDHATLFDVGVVAIFGPGTIIAQAAIKLLDWLSKK
jgi:methylmalonyl-CoA mutase